MTAELLLAELSQPACFPHAPASVEIVQTHLSVVCLAGDRVYKLKKAVTLPFVDFAPLAARRQACRDEVRLNRRLCPDVYLGAAALRRVDGQLRFAALGDDEGDDDLDVAIVMRRLPQERMLDELVARQEVSEAEIRDLARHVAAFHAGADRGPGVVAAGDPHRLVGFAADNFSELQSVPDHGLPAELLGALESVSAAEFAERLPDLGRRAAAGRVVDGHGDLHTRNVCLTTPPAIYDCIEFEPAFRCGDVAGEVAFLAMDLRYRGAPDLAAAFVAAYVEAAGDAEVALLLPLLCSYRAMVRAKVAAMVAAEPELSAGDRAGARQSAWRHLLLAAACAFECRGPHWLLVCGPPASGKSQLCRRLTETVRWQHLATDVVRKQLAGLAPTDRARPEHYAAEFSERTYAELARRAAELTRRGATVVLLDGNFPTARHRAEARVAAQAAGARMVVIHVAVDPVTAARRAARRSAEGGNVSDAGPEVTTALHARFEAPAAAEAAVELDGTQPTDGLAATLLTALLSAAR